MQETDNSDQADIEYLIQEVKLLQDALEDAEVAVQESELAVEDALHKEYLATAKASIVEQKADEKIARMNAELMKKVLIYSDLIDEYDIIRRLAEPYLKRAGTTINTHQLNHLRQMGGYPKV